MAFNREQFIADLEAMTVLELKELVTALEEHFGVTAAAPVAVAVAGGEAAAAEEAAAAAAADTLATDSVAAETAE